MFCEAKFCGSTGPTGGASWTASWDLLNRLALLYENSSRLQLYESIYKESNPQEVVSKVQAYAYDTSYITMIIGVVGPVELDNQTNWPVLLKMLPSFQPCQHLNDAEIFVSISFH